MHIDQQLSEAFRSGDVVKIDAIFAEFPRLRRKKTALTGNWLCSMAARTTPTVIKYLLASGFDVNSKSEFYGISALTAAARLGRIDNVRVLLENGAEIDTSESVRNPLFAAIQAAGIMRYKARDEAHDPEAIIKLLFAHGIDASVKYDVPPGTSSTAPAFAILEGLPDTCELINHLRADGNRATFDRLQAEAIADNERDSAAWKAFETHTALSDDEDPEFQSE